MNVLINRSKSFSPGRFFVQRSEFPQLGRSGYRRSTLQDHRCSQSKGLALSGVSPHIDDKRKPEESHPERSSQALRKVVYVQFLSKNLLHTAVTTGIISLRAHCHLNIEFGGT